MNLAQDIVALLREAAAWTACLVISVSLATIGVLLILVAIAVIEAHSVTDSPGARTRWGKVDYQYREPWREELTNDRIRHFWDLRQAVKRAHMT